MVSVQVRCYAELNDTLPLLNRKRAFTHPLQHAASITMLARELAISPEVIDLVLVNGESVGLGHEVHDGDHVSLYPVFESFDITNLTRVRDKPLRKPRFVLDVHLGKLSNHLRMLGFDTAFNTVADDAALMKQSREEERTLLSKDRRLMQREEITRKYCVRGSDPRLQLIEVLDRFDLYRSLSPFTRCIECNTLLVPAEEGTVRHRLPPKVEMLFHEFQLCPHCDRVYWKGSHYEHMKHFIDDILQQHSCIDANRDSA